MILFDFSNTVNLDAWYVVDDGVMGGRSQGSLATNYDGHGVFEGRISVENNGGFSSLRHTFQKKDIKDFANFAIRLKGDGKNYQFRGKSSSRQRFSYITEFKTTGAWQTIRISMSDMYPSFRGYKIDAPNYTGEFVSEIAFLIGNKKAESFKLVIDTIALE